MHFMMVYLCEFALIVALSKILGLCIILINWRISILLKILKGILLPMVNNRGELYHIVQE